VGTVEGSFDRLRSLPVSLKRRADVPAVPVSQYSVTLVRS
jgi:hypothetical protein